MASKADKAQKLEVIKESVAKAKVAIVADFKGLSVTEITDLRRSLQKEGADLTVTKNTLAKIAIQDTPFEGLSEFLQGPTALAFGFQDEVAPAKVLKKYMKGNNKVELRGGVVDGKVLSIKEIDQLANLPSKEELYAKILGSINSPASGIANCVNGVMRSLVIAMDGVRKQKESA